MDVLFNSRLCRRVYQWRTSVHRANIIQHRTTKFRLSSGKVLSIKRSHYLLTRCFFLFTRCECASFFQVFFVYLRNTVHLAGSCCIEDNVRIIYGSRNFCYAANLNGSVSLWYEIGRNEAVFTLALPATTVKRCLFHIWLLRDAYLLSDKIARFLRPFIIVMRINEDIVLLKNPAKHLFVNRFSWYFFSFRGLLKRFVDCLSALGLASKDICYDRSSIVFDLSWSFVLESP